MKPLVCLTVVLLALCLSLSAQDNPIFERGERAPNIHHVGNVWLSELNPPDSIFNYSIVVATFDPGARLDWHTHPGGQVLLIIDGIGFYHERGKEKQIVHRGDVIKCLPGIEHWHGAIAENGFTYLATTPVQNGRTIWGQRVTDEEYQSQSTTSASDKEVAEQELINLSKKKWQWMSDKNVDSLSVLFNDKAVFVHMGATMTKDEELNVIKTGGIHYKRATIQETSVQFIGNTAILLNKLQLDAVVGGNEVTNPFVVTEVYIRWNDEWTLGSMSFTKLITPP